MKFCSNVCKNKTSVALRKAKNIVEESTKPTDYRPEYSTTTLQEYYAWVESKDQREMIPTGKDGMNLIILNNCKLLSMRGYAKFLSKTEKTLEEWILVHPDFAEAMDQLKKDQKDQLLEKGMIRQYDPNLAKFALINNHGMKEAPTNQTNIMFGIVKTVYKMADEIQKEIRDAEIIENKSIYE
jgi:hypothetical protein